MRIVISLFTAVITACGLAVATAGSASALGGESLGCRVTPGRSATFSPKCSNTVGASSYQVTFQVLNETAPSTYAWSISATPSATVTSGCTSTSNACAISVPNEDNYVTATVTLTQGSATETLTSHAFISQYCGPVSCA